MLKFVVQEHHSKKFHFDLRLEMDGVAKSWAIPKGMPRETVKKMRLCIQVQDHDLASMRFSGRISSGGGIGLVKIKWEGVYKLITKKDDKLVFQVWAQDSKGRKLEGVYILFRWEERYWLLQKMKRRWNHVSIERTIGQGRRHSQDDPKRAGIGRVCNIL